MAARFLTVAARKKGCGYGNFLAESAMAERSMRIAAYKTTTITSQRKAVSGREPTMKAAIGTPMSPPTASPTATGTAYALFHTKRTLATGMRNAAEPIMIGNAAAGFMPSKAGIF